MRFSRRHFGRMAAAVLPASLLGQGGGRRPIPKPNSRFAGVQIGVISYSFNTVPAMDLIPTIAKLGINEVELMSNHAETLVGAPAAPPRGPAARGRWGTRRREAVGARERRRVDRRRKLRRSPTIRAMLARAGKIRNLLPQAQDAVLRHLHPSKRSFTRTRRSGGPRTRL